ncbi:MAG: aminotransferase class I/II-fold pyridoxal phosphate-dependent enzyme, partial [Firmicutes bacterium]|nr:aminotransferase class I/II-fold pyridoxal phosphate-dependent enzyme [Bacillota bacterium]
CHRFISEYDFEGHLENIRSLYRHKASLMLDALDNYMPKKVTYTRPEGGLFLWCTLPKEDDMNLYVKKAAAENVFVVPGTAFCCDPNGISHSFRLNYSMPADDEIEKGIKILAQLL